MVKLLPFLGSCIVFSFVTTNVSAQQQSITLSDVLDATVEKQVRNNATTKHENDRESEALSWLDGVPTISVLYLHDQNRDGTKEAEISLSLPIKSTTKTQLEAQIGSTSQLIKQSAKRQLYLYYSGILRQLVWGIREQKVELASSKKKHTILVDLLNRYQNMVQLNALPQYAFNLLKKEVNDNRILQLRVSHNIQNLHKQYSNITGLHQLPDDVIENLPTDAQNALGKHPDVQAMDAAWETLNISLDTQRKSAEPWHLQMTARRIDAANLSENHIGLGVEIPISIGEELSVTQRNEYLQTKLQYELERRILMAEIVSSTASAHAEYQYLTKKQSMLNENASTLDALEKSITQLLEANTQNQVIHIRNLIDLIDSQNEIVLNRIALQRQIAMIRQAAGMPL